MVIKEATLDELDELACWGFIDRTSYPSKVALGDSEADFNCIVSHGEMPNGNIVNIAASPDENGRMCLLITTRDNEKELFTATCCDVLSPYIKLNIKAPIDIKKQQAMDYLKLVIEGAFCRDTIDDLANYAKSISDECFIEMLSN